MDLTLDQINQLKSLGLSPKKPTSDHLRSNIFPLLSVSGLTLLSFSGIILLKNKNNVSISSPSEIRDLTSEISPSPTQVPKSIQHYLLASQQYFTQALQSQQSPLSSRGTTGGLDPSTPDPQSTIELLNNSILAATQAIKEFPNDYRGYQQRGRIYQSLIDSKPELINQSITDLSSAQKLNPNSVEIVQNLASLFAKKGDAQNTLIYLAQTVALDPTKAQNFYDLAKIQQQTGLIPQAIQTYTQLLPLITDATQKTQVEAEKTALEKLLAQNPNPSSEIRDLRSEISPSPSEIQNPELRDVQRSRMPSDISIDSPTIQATDITTKYGQDNALSLIIAAPEEGKKIEVENLADSNALAGNATLAPNQKEISITNSNLKPESQVYVSLLKGAKNQTLKVLSKSNDSFIVGFDTAIPEEVEFKWWIIN